MAFRPDLWKLYAANSGRRPLFPNLAPRRLPAPVIPVVTPVGVPATDAEQDLVDIDADGGRDWARDMRADK